MIPEITVNLFLQSYATPLLTEAFKAITELGSPAFWFVIAAWLFWLGKEKKSFMAMTIVLFSGIIAGALKYIIARPRPQGIELLINETGYAMPSGHSTIAGAFAAYGALSKWIEKKFKLILIILALLVGVSRIYLGVHYISDVIAGLLIGAIIGWIAIKFETKLEKMHFHFSKLAEEAIVIIIFIAAILASFFLIEQYAAAFAVLGYFLGYFIYQHTKINLSKNIPKNKTKLAAIMLIGTAVIGALGYFASKNHNLYGAGAFLLIGLFITLIWPYIIGKSFGKN